MPEISLAQLGLSAEHLKQLQTLLVKYVPQAEVWAYERAVLCARLLISTSAVIRP